MSLFKFTVEVYVIADTADAAKQHMMKEFDYSFKQDNDLQAAVYLDDGIEVIEKPDGFKVKFGSLNVGDRLFDPVSGEYWIKTGESEGKQDSGDSNDMDVFDVDEMVIV